MIKVTSEIRDNNDMECLEVSTIVLLGVEERLKGYQNAILKKELKCLISTLVEEKPDLLFNALEEVMEEGLHND